MKITKVVFRKYPDGEILALFPYEEWSDGLVTSYQHLGQHGGADYLHCIKNTVPAIHKEYKDLWIELRTVGYDPEPIHVDMNGEELSLGQDVYVHPDIQYWYHGEFQGRVSGFKNDYVLVTDQDDNTFCVDEFNIEIE